MVYNDIHLSNTWFKSVIRMYVVFIAFASLGLRPWDVNTIKTSIHPYNQHVDISRFKSKGRVVLLGDFNARVGKGLDSDDVVGSFGEEVCNSNGTKLIELMQQSDLVSWNNREFCIEPQWTRIMPSLGQHSILLLIMLLQIDI